MSHPRTIATLTLLLLAAPSALAQGDGYGGKKDGYDAAPLSAEQEAELRASFARLMATRRNAPVTDAPCCDESAPCEACETVEHTSRSLVEALIQSPASWEVVTPLVHDAFVAADTTVGERDLMLQLLGWTGSERVGAIGAALWKDGARHFTDDHVLVFAERGCDAVWDEVKKRARKPGKDGDVRAAVLVAMRAYEYEKGPYAGKKPVSKGEAGHELDPKELERDAKQARKALTAAARVREVSEENALNALLAAACLERLGEEGSLKAVQEKVHQAVLAALDGGQLERARRVAFAADFVHEAASSYGRFELGYMGQRVKAHSFARSQEVATADQVFELIERITPL